MQSFRPRRFAAVAAGLALAGTLATSAWAAANSGQLDTSFNGTGYTTTPIGDFSVAQGVTTQGDKTIAVGLTFNPTGQFAVARYNKNGSLDPSFGTGGIATASFNGDDQATSVATQGDKIVVAGITTPDGGTTWEVALARFNKDGSLDASFGTGGETVSNFGDGYDFADAVAVKGDSIVVAGETRAGGSGDDNFLVAQYKKNGQLDTSFGTGGFTATDFNGDFDSANGLAFQGDKIVLAGYVNNPAAGNYDFGLARYTKNGQLDTSFGTGGKVETDFFGGDDAAHAVDVKGDSIVAVGDAVNGTQTVGNATNTLYDFAAAMYDKNGKLDPKFGTGGKAVLSAGDVDQGSSGGFGPGNSVWVGGSTEDYSDNLSTGYFAVGRWTKSGQPDPKFGTNGTTRNTLGGDSAAALAGTAGPGDAITLAGIDIDQGAFAVARYTNKG